MTKKPLIQFNVSAGEYARIKSLRPKKEWDETRIKDFYREVFFEGLNSIRYQKKEWEQRIRAAEARASNAEFLLELKRKKDGKQ